MNQKSQEQELPSSARGETSPESEALIAEIHTLLEAMPLPKLKKLHRRLCEPDSLQTIEEVAEESVRKRALQKRLYFFKKLEELIENPNTKPELQYRILSHLISRAEGVPGRQAEVIDDENAIETIFITDYSAELPQK